MISVLVIDDDPDILGITKTYLEINGILSIETALSAKEGLEKYYQYPYDAIIADYLLPDMDGISFLSTIRSSNTEIFFIIFTGYSHEDVVIEALNNGADLYLKKGENPIFIYSLIEQKIIENVREIEIFEREKQQRVVFGIKEKAPNLEAGEKTYETMSSISPDMIPAAIVMYDAKGIILSANQTAQDLFGTGDLKNTKTLQDNLIHCLYREDGSVLPPDAYPVYATLMTKKPYKNKIMQFQHPVTKEIISIAVSTNPLIDDDDAIHSIILAAMDISRVSR